MYLRQRQDDERGSMLIVALGILMLLTVLAVTFVSLMRLERAATVNYVDGVRARLIAEAGLQAAMNQLRISAGTDSFSDPDDDWVYARGNYWLPVEDSLPVRQGDKSYVPALRERMASFADALGSTYNMGKDPNAVDKYRAYGDQYRIKVIDTQTQFNLNSAFEILDDSVDHNYVRFLDALGVAISICNPNARKQASTSKYGRNPVHHARYPRGSPNALRGARAIYAFRQSQEGKRFNSKESLLEVLESEDDFHLLKDYVTTISWMDPNTISARSIRLDSDYTKSGNEKPWSNVIKAGKRSPININLASAEILAANLAGIAGRAIFKHTGPFKDLDSRLQLIDDNTPFKFDRTREAVSYFGLRGVLAYFRPFGFEDPKAANDEVNIEGALNFAFKIRCRVGSHKPGCGPDGNNHVSRTPGVGPFKTLTEWEAFVDNELTNNFLHSFTDSEGRSSYPTHERARLYHLDQTAITNSTSPSDAEIRAHPRFIPWFYDCVRSMIKANADPNAKLSSWNPDPAADRPLDKGGLLYFQDPNNPASNKIRRQTNEWCLNSKGIFEIISLGEILGPPPEDATQGTEPQMYAQAKMRGILQLYQTQTHTTQRDFERHGYEFINDRLAISSYPVPKVYWDPQAMEESNNGKVQGWLNDGGEDEALHGSELDGHLQLSTFTHFGTGSGVQDSRGFLQGFGDPLFEFLVQDRRVADRISSLISPSDPLVADTSGAQSNNAKPGTPPRGADRKVKNGWGWPFGTALQGVNYVDPYTKSATEQEAWRWDVLTPDGYLNTELRRSTLWYRAADKNSKLPPTDIADAANKEKLRGDSMDEVLLSNSSGQRTGGNVAPTNKGAVEFWFKPEFDWAMEEFGPTGSPTGRTYPDDRLCGFLATSHITQNPWGIQGDKSTYGSWTRGTQMYVTKNSLGELRITRLFFDVVGPSKDPQEEPIVLNPSGSTKISFFDFMELKNGIWPPSELLSVAGTVYEKIKFARMDYWIPFQNLQHWHKGEWHHIAFSWSDYTPDAEIKIWIDGTKVPASKYRTRPSGGIGDRYEPSFLDPNTNTPLIGYQNYVSVVGSPPTISVLGQPNVPWTGPSSNDGKLPAFVRLNARTGPTSPPGGMSQFAWEENLFPKDQLYIGSVHRDQALSEGLFKYATVADLPANGTIDEVRFYDGTTVPTGQGSPQRFEDAGLWVNEFDSQGLFPSGVNHLPLGSLSFTAHLPTRGSSYNAGQGQLLPESWPAGNGSVTVWAEVWDASGSVIYSSDAASSPQNLVPIDPTLGTGLKAIFDNNVTGNASVPMIDAKANPIMLRRGDRVVYIVEIEPATNGKNEILLSPVLDDVSLITLLPNPRVLLKRRVED